jgi:CYTH domain-containing protein
MSNLEVERKFLVNVKYFDFIKENSSKHFKIRQGYFNKNVRVRITDEVCTLTVKSSPNLVRKEYEYPIPIADALDMYENIVTKQIVKTRYLLRYGGDWEIDVYYHEDGEIKMILAEIELDSWDQEVILPFWVGDEVTDQKKFYNCNL